MVAAAVTAAAAVAARNPHAEKLRLTPEGKRLAKRALLTSSDLGPDWTRLPSVPDNSSLTCPSFDPDFSAYTINGKATSSFVQSGLAQISSSSEVYASRLQAAADFSKGARPELAPCLRYAVAREFRTSGAGIRASVLSSRVQRAPKLGERSAAYRVVTRVRQSGVSFKLYTDFVVIQRGRTIVALGFTGVDSPIPSQMLYDRMVAARMR